MPTDANGAVGSMNLSKEKRIELAQKSLDWNCETCKSCNRTALPEVERKAEAEEDEEISSPALSDSDTTSDTTNEEPMSAPITREPEVEAQVEPQVRQRQQPAQADENARELPQQREMNEIPPAVAAVMNGQVQPRVVQVSPVKLNIFLGFLLSLLVFLVARRYLF